MKKIYRKIKYKILLFFRKYFYKTMLFVILLAYISAIFYNAYKNNNGQIDFLFASGLLSTTLPFVITILIQLHNEKNESNSFKTNGCPNIIFNRVQEFEIVKDENGNPIKDKCLFKARFFDDKHFFLKQAKITNVVINISTAEFEDYSIEKQIYDDPESEYCDLEFTPKSDDKIDKLEEDKNEFYYLITTINYDFNELTKIDKYIKLSIELSVMTIFGLETKLNCKLIFKKEKEFNKDENGEIYQMRKEISHRFMNFKSIEYIG